MPKERININSVIQMLFKINDWINKFSLGLSLIFYFLANYFGPILPSQCNNDYGTEVIIKTYFSKFKVRSK